MAKRTKTKAKKAAKPSSGPGKNQSAEAAEATKAAVKAVKAAKEAENRAVEAVNAADKAVKAANKAAEVAKKTDKKADKKKAEKAAKLAKAARKEADKSAAEAEKRAEKASKAANKAAEFTQSSASPKSKAEKAAPKKVKSAPKKTARKKAGPKKAVKKTTAKKTAGKGVKSSAAKVAKRKVKSSKKAAAPKAKAKSAPKTKAPAKAPTKTSTKTSAKPNVKSKTRTAPKTARVVAPTAPVDTKPAVVTATRDTAPKPVASKPVANESVAKPKAAPKPKPAVEAVATPTSPKASEEKPRYYITTAISYPNGPPHIGHAYEAIATDAIARFKRLDGYDVLFLTGTDEHGSKIQQTATKEGISPKELVDRNVEHFAAMVKRMNCSNDDFIRTTEERHFKSSAAIWQKMEANGDIYLDRYAGWYSVRDERYYAEDETHINEHKVRLATETGTPVEWVEEESYFFKLSAYQQKLLDLYESDPTYVLPKERLNEVASFVRGGLQDLSISRTTFDWGIPVPGSPKHIMYVWVDALTNYITAAGFPDTDSDKFKRYWPADLHVIGKDIVRFHAVYWPAFLMSAGVEIPRRIYSHGFLFNRGEKISKSVGNVIDPFTLADAYGVDPLRYFFLREVPFGQDGSYSHEAIVNRINADLANDLGNLAQRSLTMVTKQLGGVLPTPGAFSDNDKAILDMADGMLAKAREWMQTQALHQVLNTVWAVVAEANRYFAGEAPWALAKTDPPRQGTVLYVTAEVIRQVAIMAQFVMPEASAKLLDLLAVEPDKRSFAALAERLPPGVQLPPPSPVFPRYVEPPADTEPK